MKSSEIKITTELNERLWNRGITKPPRKITVKMVKDEDGLITISLPKVEKTEPSKEDKSGQPALPKMKEKALTEKKEEALPEAKQEGLPPALRKKRRKNHHPPQRRRLPRRRLPQRQRSQLRRKRQPTANSCPFAEERYFSS